MSKGWKNFEVHNKRRLSCLEETIDRNMMLKAILVRAQNSERSENSYRKSFKSSKIHVYHQGLNVGRNINVNVASDKISHGNVKHVNRY